jgi:hypothetical protein
MGLDWKEWIKTRRMKISIFSDSFILVIVGYIRISFHLPYRQMEGIIKATGKKRLPANPPSYGHIYKRIKQV